MTMFILTNPARIRERDLMIKSGLRFCDVISGAGCTLVGYGFSEERVFFHDCKCFTSGGSTDHASSGHRREHIMSSGKPKRMTEASPLIVTVPHCAL